MESKVIMIISLVQKGTFRHDSQATSNSQQEEMAQQKQSSLIVVDDIF